MKFLEKEVNRILYLLIIFFLGAVALRELKSRETKQANSIRVPFSLIEMQMNIATASTLVCMYNSHALFTLHLIRAIRSLVAA